MFIQFILSLKLCKLWEREDREEQQIFAEQHFNGKSSQIIYKHNYSYNRNWAPWNLNTTHDGKEIKLKYIFIISTWISSVFVLKEHGIKFWQNLKWGFRMLKVLMEKHHSGLNILWINLRLIWWINESKNQSGERVY